VSLDLGAGVIMRFTVILALAFFAHSASAEISPLHDGDVVFQTSRSSQSIAVQNATSSRYSHMGIVFIRKGKPFVYEAASEVQYTPLDVWVARGIGGHVVAKRLQNASAILNPAGVERLRQAARDFEGKPYDLTFEWSDDRIYCSELVWKIYQRALGVELGALQKIKEFNLKDPAVHQKMKERYGAHVPLEEPAISPVAMFDSSRLVTVLER
jgi:uncharacterized protein YycO